MTILLKLSYTFNAVPITITADIFWVEIDELILKLYGISKTENSPPKYKSGGLSLPDFKVYYNIR